MPGLRRGIGVLRDFQARLAEDRVVAVAAGVTFYIMLALVPALSVVVSVFGLVADPAQVVARVDELAALMPREAAVLISEQAARVAARADSTLSLAALIGMAVALWSANGGTRALMEALGVAWGLRERRGFLRFNLLSLGFTFGAAVGFLLLNAAVTLLPVLLGWLWPGAPVAWVLLVLRWPVVLAMLVTALALLYQFGPDRTAADVPARAWRWLSPGTVAASLGLILASLGFSFYVRNFGAYDETYGSLAAVVVTMLWIWLSNVIVLTGAGIDAWREGPVQGGGQSTRPEKTS